MISTLRLGRALAVASLAASLLVVAPFTSANAATTALQSMSGGLDLDANSAQLFGWVFSNSSSINVISLGIFDYNGGGLATDHEVGIFRTSDSSLVVSKKIAAQSNSTVGANFLLETLASSVTLAPDTYAIIATMPANGGDRQRVRATSVTFAPQLTYLGNRLGSGSALGLPSTGSTDFGNSIFGPNFQFESNDIPEPGTVAFLLGVGAFGTVAARRRLRK